MTEAQKAMEKQKEFQTGILQKQAEHERTLKIHYKKQAEAEKKRRQARHQRNIKIENNGGNVGTIPVKPNIDATEAKTTAATASKPKSAKAKPKK